MFECSVFLVEWQLRLIEEVDKEIVTKVNPYQNLPGIFSIEVMWFDGFSLYMYIDFSYHHLKIVMSSKKTLLPVFKRFQKVIVNESLKSSKQRIFRISQYLQLIDYKLKIKQTEKLRQPEVEFNSLLIVTKAVKKLYNTF